jgi:orotidine-5'-phosphate decarboxylase
MANPNIVSVGFLYGKTDVAKLSTNAVTVAANSAASGKILKVNSLTVCCVSSGTTEVSVWFARGTNTYHLAKNTTIQAGGDLSVIGRPIYVMEGDSLVASAASAASAEAVCSYEEIS